MNWDVFNKVFGDNARPWLIIWLGFCLGIACMVPATAPIAIPAAAGVLGVSIGARSWDKKNAGQAEVDKAKITQGGGDGAAG